VLLYVKVRIVNRDALVGAGTQAQGFDFDVAIKKLGR